MQLLAAIVIILLSLAATALFAATAAGFSPEKPQRTPPQKAESCADITSSVAPPPLPAPASHTHSTPAVPTQKENSHERQEQSS